MSSAQNTSSSSAQIKPSTATSADNVFTTTIIPSAQNTSPSSAQIKPSTATSADIVFTTTIRSTVKPSQPTTTALPPLENGQSNPWKTTTLRVVIAVVVFLLIVLVTFKLYLRRRRRMAAGAAKVAVTPFLWIDSTSNPTQPLLKGGTSRDILPASNLEAPPPPYVYPPISPPMPLPLLHRLAQKPQPLQTIRGSNPHQA